MATLADLARTVSFLGLWQRRSDRPDEATPRRVSTYREIDGKTYRITIQEARRP